MKDKNLPLDNNTLSLEELTKEANNIIESLESEKDLQNSKIGRASCRERV